MSIATRNLSLLCLIILFGCNKESTAEMESYKLISMLINGYVKPVQPPPPISISELELDKRIDSINKSFSDKEFIVYLKPLSEIGAIHKDISNNYSFSNLNNRIYSPIKFIDTSKLNTRKNIIFYNKNSKSLNNLEVDITLSFSEILFNPKYDIAILKLGVSRGKLSGFSSILICKKINGEWEIIGDSLIEISFFNKLLPTTKYIIYC